MLQIAGKVINVFTVDGGKDADGNLDRACRFQALGRQPLEGQGGRGTGGLARPSVALF